MSPAKRRDAVHHLEKMFAVSQRRACAITGQPRSTQRLTPPSANKEEALARRIEALVRENPRFGYRRITAMLRLEGWQINAKRVYRIWRREGYRWDHTKRKGEPAASRSMPAITGGQDIAMIYGPMILCLIALKMGGP